jgi:hypothetical protein
LVLIRDKFIAALATGKLELGAGNIGLLGGLGQTIEAVDVARREREPVRPQGSRRQIRSLRKQAAFLVGVTPLLPLGLPGLLGGFGSLGNAVVRALATAPWVMARGAQDPGVLPQAVTDAATANLLAGPQAAALPVRDALVKYLIAPIGGPAAAAAFTPDDPVRIMARKAIEQPSGNQPSGLQP